MNQDPFDEWKPLRSWSIQPDALYTTVETAAFLRMSRRSLERWRREGRGPKVTRLWHGGRPLYLGRHILAVIKASEQ